LILVVADRPTVRREAARRLLEGGLGVRGTSTIAEAISIVVLESPACVVFDGHLAASEGTHAVSALLRLLETYRLPAVDISYPNAPDDDRLEGAGHGAPLRPGPQPPSLRAEAELPNESVG